MTLLLMFGLICQGLAGAAEVSLESAEEQSFKQATALADPSIVRIETVGGLEQIDDVLLANGPTSGVVVSADGFIISSTFNFVSKPTSILVTLSDGRRMAAKQIANDRLRLLTLLKIDAEGLTAAKPAPRNEMKVGQWALALGRTLDNSSPSLSVGIVSALNRVWGKAIQTDAKTSPVNYGGALVDIEGRTLGVIVPMSPSGSGETAGVEWYDGGIGFAIPLEDIYSSLDRLKQGTDLRPGLMGVTFAGGQSSNVPADIDRVRYNSPAQSAGLRSKDRVIEADGEKIVRIAQLKQVLGRKYAGDSIKLLVKRGDESLPIEITMVGELIPYEFPYLGILPERSSSTSGAGLRFVFAGSPASAAGLERGDRITKLNDSEVKDARSLSDLVSRARPGDKATVGYTRDGKELSTEITLSSLPDSIVDELPSIAIPAATEPQKEAEEKPKADVEKKPDDALKTGRFTETLPGHDHEYWAYVPEGYNPANAYGLVVWIHPPGDLMESDIAKFWKPICDHRGLILIAPKAEKIAAWQQGEAEFVKGLIGHMREKYTIDSSRVVIHSHGNSGPMAWYVALSQRDIIKGVAVSGFPFAGQPPENTPENRQQLLFICGDDNKLFARVAANVLALKKLKFPVTLLKVPGLGTKYPPAEKIEQIGRWVDCLDRI